MRPVALLLCSAALLGAHVGSPDVFFEGKAGPYPIFVTVRPPSVIPGVAQVEMRVPGAGVRQIKVVPFPLTGPGAKYPPTPDLATPSREDPQLYTSSIWLMASGSYQVRIEVEGSLGAGELSVPIPAVASHIKRMDRGLGAVLFGIMVLLVAALVSIVGASVREAKLEPGAPSTQRLATRSWLAMGLTAGLLVCAIYSGNRWWTSEASDYSNNIYKPMQMSASLKAANLSLKLQDPGWLKFRKTDDFIPDHNHLMHLFAIRMPGMDRMWHLHPELIADATFSLALPSMPAGRYKLFGDVVHADGFPETLVAEVNLPEINGRPLSGDDSQGTAWPVSQAQLERTAFPLRDGFRMVWVRSPAPLKPKQAIHLEFHVEDATGRPAEDMQLYMGMQGHAELVSLDGSVFAHVHPDGSVPMAAVMLTKVAMQHPRGTNLPATVSFPYGFPKPGRYRIFVQVQRAGHPETGIFDAEVT